MNSLKIVFCVCFTLLCACSSNDDDSSKEEVPTLSDENPVVIIETSLGQIVLELDGLRAPITVANFLSYMDDGFYDDTLFHRTIPNFMIQGGGFGKGLKKPKSLKPPIKNEATNKVSNNRGTVAMARTSQKPDSATSQFFINLVDNSRLDHRGKEPRKYGYTVFGKVIKGMEVVDKIAGIDTYCPTSNKRGRCKRKLPPGLRDVPKEEVLITTIALQEE